MSDASDQLIDPVAVLQAGGIKPGQVVADFGCGAIGHFIFPASRMVGESGKVIAIDIQKRVIDSINSRRALDGAHNVTALWGDIERAKGVRVADETMDLSLLVNNLFLSKDREVLAEELRRCTKTGGKLVVIDWVEKATPLGPPLEARVGAEAAKTLLAAHGFAFDRAFIPGPASWGLVFTRAS